MALAIDTYTCISYLCIILNNSKGMSTIYTLTPRACIWQPLFDEKGERTGTYWDAVEALKKGETISVYADGKDIQLYSQLMAHVFELASKRPSQIGNLIVLHDRQAGGYKAILVAGQTLYYYRKVVDAAAIMDFDAAKPLRKHIADMQVAAEAAAEQSYTTVNPF